jgi:hypothetical protein
MILAILEFGFFCNFCSAILEFSHINNMMLMKKNRNKVKDINQEKEISIPYIKLKGID